MFDQTVSEDSKLLNPQPGILRRNNEEDNKTLEHRLLLFPVFRNNCMIRQWQRQPHLYQSNNLTQSSHLLFIFSRGAGSTSGLQIFPCGVFQIYKFSLLYFKLKKVMTFFLGMNYKFSLYIFQLFPKFPPILAKNTNLPPF